jgi:hypothetical protein
MKGYIAEEDYIALEAENSKLVAALEDILHASELEVDVRESSMAVAFDHANALLSNLMEAPDLLAENSKLKGQLEEAVAALEEIFKGSYGSPTHGSLATIAANAIAKLKEA